VLAPQRSDIEYNRVYRRAEFATRPEPWGSPLPSIEIIGEGKVFIYGSNLPRHTGEALYQPPIEDTLADIQDKMTLLNVNPFCAGFHEACMCSVWIAFVWDESSSTEAPIIRDACLLDWELDYRRKGC
jgi:hypothetical protein